MSKSRGKVEVSEECTEEVVSKPNKPVVWLQENKNLLIKVFIITTILGLLGNAFAYFNLDLNSDFLAEYRFDYLHKIECGRFLQPVVRYILSGIIVTPWLEGCWFIFFTGCTVFLVCKTFNYEKVLSILIIAGLFTNNLWVLFITAKCLHDLATYALALLLAVLAFSYYVKNKENLKFYKIIIISIMMICSQALYQAFFAVTITLILIDTIVCLLHGNNFGKELKKLFTVFFVLGIAALFYYLISWVITLMFDTNLSGDFYSPMASLQSPLQILLRIPVAYSDFLNGLFISTTILPKSIYYGPSLLINIFNWVLLVLAVLIIVKFIIERKLNIENILLILILFLILPYAASCIYILSGVRRILYCSYILYYVFILEMFKFSNVKKLVIDLNKFVKVITWGILLIIFSNMQLANTFYTKNSLDKEAALLVMTKVVDKIEAMPNYVGGSTEVVFFGELNKSKYWHDTLIYLKNGSKIDVFKSIEFNIWDYKKYTEYVMKINMNCYNYSIYDKNCPVIRVSEQMEVIRAMPTFPTDGYVKEIDGIIVVKLSEF